MTRTTTSRIAALIGRLRSIAPDRQTIKQDAIAGERWLATCLPITLGG